MKLNIKSNFILRGVQRDAEQERQWKNKEKERGRVSREMEETEKKMECGRLSEGRRERTEEINTVLEKQKKSQMMEKLVVVQQGAFKISEADASATSDQGRLYLCCHDAAKKCISVNETVGIV